MFSTVKRMLMYRLAQTRTNNANFPSYSEQLYLQFNWNDSRKSVFSNSNDIRTRPGASRTNKRWQPICSQICIPIKVEYNFWLEIEFRSLKSFRESAVVINWCVTIHSKLIELATKPYNAFNPKFPESSEAPSDVTFQSLKGLVQIFTFQSSAKNSSASCLKHTHARQTEAKIISNWKALVKIFETKMLSQTVEPC